MLKFIALTLLIAAFLLWEMREFFGILLVTYIACAVVVVLAPVVANLRKTPGVEGVDYDAETWNGDGQ